ncbi:MAG: hypothetical protein H0V71_02295 [Chloroflexi bacterium]|nr:hypothetical protein [Chloroflexota bacterium]
MMLLVVAVVIAALGPIAHNLISLPLSPLAPETVGPVLVYAGLLGWSLRSRLGSASRWSLAVWALLNVVGGGIVSALPLPFLPFVPDQNLGHHLAHVIYSVAQLPLLAILVGPKSSWATVRGPS